tara:strand:- start:531 stop:2030 length:1500 start_codon:yes stop_codon:yes gene_type:complete
MDNKNIFICGADTQFVQETFKKVMSSGNSKIMGVLVTEFQKKIDDNFKCEQIIEQDLFKNSFFLSKISSYNLEIDKEFLKKSKNYFHLFASSYDRIQPIPNAVYNLNNIFQKQLIFFKNFIEINKINEVFFINTPHYPSSISIYIVAKLLNVNTIIQQRTDIDSLFFLRKDIDNFSALYQIDNENTALKKHIDKYFKYNNIHSIFTSLGIKKNNLTINLFNSKIFKYFIITKNIFIILYSDLFLRLFGIKKKDINYSSDMGNYYENNLKITLIKIKRIFDSFNLYKHLCTISVEPKLDENFLLFALHFQPERSTMPEGGIFNDQILALKLLSQNIPDNFIIYVKEHPRQFDIFPQLSKRHYRNKEYYNEINNIPKVKILHPFQNLENLILNAKFISTITGSVGIEAIKKNKPCIIFSQTWYMKHPLSYLANHSKDLQNIFLNTSYLNIPKTNHNKFINYIKKYLFFSSDGKLNINKNNLNTYSNNLSNELIKIYTNKHK